VALPPEIPDGPLEVVAGMYRPDTGQRLPVVNADGHPQGDQVVLGSVVVDSRQ